MYAGWWKVSSKEDCSDRSSSLCSCAFEILVFPSDDDFYLSRCFCLRML